MDNISIHPYNLFAIMHLVFTLWHAKKPIIENCGDTQDMSILQNNGDTHHHHVELTCLMWHVQCQGFNVNPRRNSPRGVLQSVVNFCETAQRRKSRFWKSTQGLLRRDRSKSSKTPYRWNWCYNFIVIDYRHNLVIGMSVTGLISFMGSTPVTWHAKSQLAAQTATFGRYELKQQGL